LTRLRLVGGGGADKNHQSLILQQPYFTKTSKKNSSGKGSSASASAQQSSSKSLSSSSVTDGNTGPEGGDGDSRSHGSPEDIIISSGGVNVSSTHNSASSVSNGSNAHEGFMGETAQVHRVHDEVLFHAVRDMLHPLLALKDVPLGQWETDLTPIHPRHAPPAYAKLQGPKGFGKVHSVTSLVLNNHTTQPSRCNVCYCSSHPDAISSRCHKVVHLFRHDGMV